MGASVASLSQGYDHAIQHGGVEPHRVGRRWDEAIAQVWGKLMGGLVTALRLQVDRKNGAVVRGIDAAQGHGIRRTVLSDKAAVNGLATGRQPAHIPVPPIIEAYFERIVPTTDRIQFDGILEKTVVDPASLADIFTMGTSLNMEKEFHFLNFGMGPLPQAGGIG